MKDTSEGWLQNIGVVRIDKVFTKYDQVIKFMHEDSTKDLSSSELQDYNNSSGDVEELIAKVSENVQYPHVSDTSVGGCDVFNPYYQFCEDDDIISPMTSLDGSLMHGYGSIYSEMYADTQKILWMSLGVPKFCGLKEFYGGSNSLLANVMKDGKLSLSGVAGAAIGSSINLAFKIVLWPLTVSNWIGDALTRKEHISKYYDFREAMPLYYKFVNSILIQLSITMGLHPDVNEISDWVKFSGGQFDGLPFDENDQPFIMKQGINIYRILNKRNRRARKGKSLPHEEWSDDDLLKATLNYEDSDKEEAWSHKFLGGLKDGLVGSNKFIAFRVEKSTDANESITNNSSAPSIVQNLNSISSSIRDKMFTVQAFETGHKIVDAAVETGKNFISSFFSGLTDSGLVQVVTGNGRYDIPDEWTGSEFAKNYSFDIKLRARYGNAVSIFQDLYIPLALWLAASLPRYIGRNVYTSPFIGQFFVKGLFSSPLAIIERLDIKRGDSEFGWNRVGLPLSLDIKVTVKDLSPAMFLSFQSAFNDLVDNPVFRMLDLTVDNVSMIDYISTLAGVGLYSRTAGLHKLFRKKFSAILRIKNTIFDGYFWGYFIAENLGPIQAIAQMTPYRKYPEKDTRIYQYSNN